MKKFFSLIVLCCLGVMLSVSCEKENQDRKLPVPQYKDQHARIEFRESAVADYIKDGRLPSSIEITSSGYYVANIVKQGEKKLLVDKFSILPTRSVTSFSLPALGTMLQLSDEVSGNETKAVYSTAGGDFTIETKVYVHSDSFTGAFSDDLCRTWKVKTTYLSATGGKLSSGIATVKQFNGADLKAMAEHFAANGVDIDPSEFEGYGLQGVTFTENGTLVFNFNSAEPYVGTFSVGSGDRFSYDFSAQYKSNPVVGIKGAGSIVLDGTTLTLNLETTVNYKSDTYQAQLTFELQPE